MFNYLLILHLLGAAIWTGGHLILALVVLPKVLSSRNLDALLQFEQQFEKIGMPALGIQIITGLWMAYRILPDMSAWFTFDNDISILIGMKLILLLMTAMVAIHARFWVIPKLSADNLNGFAVNILLVTLFAVSFVVVGTLFRTGL
ncbi:CopD family protein [Psychrobacter sp. ANT_WB68]|uniref:CopD family protein n=1 Tax=Psychrobacter sp. ANT_WB68 TaxID=2597355 RepID=UPI0011F2D5B1|nr:CopD family protein [Psychrobacter sp. ANT_WB68]KAA0914078.1 copper resistance protein CopD [Psychrobacter sp. ANT_WB68]